MSVKDEAVREEGFRRYLSVRISPGSVNSYVAYCRRVERDLGVDLDAADLSEVGLGNLHRELTRRGTEPRSVSNCVTSARTYARFRDAPEGEAASGEPASPIRASRPPAPVAEVERPEVIRAAQVRELLVLHGQIMDEPRARGVVRTGNSPVGDYAELLFATAFGWTLAGNSSAGHDATDAQGRRYQIKSRRITARNPSRQLSAIRRLPDRTFDVLAGVLFDEAYAVTRAVLLPHEAVLRFAKRVEHTNSWRFLLEDRVWDAAEAQDVTQALRAAQGEI